MMCFFTYFFDLTNVFKTNEIINISENIDYFISFKDLCQIEEICKKTHNFYNVLEHIRKCCISLTGATIIPSRAC